MSERLTMHNLLKDNTFRCPNPLKKCKAGFSYNNSVSLQPDDAGHVGAAVSVHVACVVDLQTKDVLRN